MNRLSAFDVLYALVGFIWLSLMLVFPSDFRMIKYMALSVLVLTSVLEAVVRRRKTRSGLFCGLIAFVSYFLFSLILGVCRGYSVDFDLISIFFITPFIALVLAQIVNSDRRLYALNTMIVVITFMTVALDLIYILDRLSIVPLPFHLGFRIFGSVAVTDQRLEFRITNQTSLMFLIPYILALSVYGPEKRLWKKWLIWASLGLGLLVGLLSGRRALQLVIVLAVVLIGALAPKMRRRLRSEELRTASFAWLVWGVVAMIAVVPIYRLVEDALGIQDLASSVVHTFLSAFDFSTGSGAIRATQVSVLVDGWLRSPLIGNGLNSYVPEYVRSATSPWSYEMVYVALLYQTGLVGLAVFIAVSYSVARNLYRRALLCGRTTGPYFLSILVGFVCFLTAGASNPMVYYVWAWSFALIGYDTCYSGESEA